MCHVFITSVTLNTGYSSLTSGIKLMGILPTQYAVNVLEYIMKMAVENVSDVSFSNQSSLNITHTKKKKNSKPTGILQTPKRWS